MITLIILVTFKIKNWYRLWKWKKVIKDNLFTWDLCPYPGFSNAKLK